MTILNVRIARRAIATSIAVGLALGGAGVAFAQSNSSGSIFGQTEAPNAVIHIENSDTGLVRDIAVDKDGRYRVASLPIGTYKVSLVSNGTTLDTRNNVAVSLGGGVNVSFNNPVASADNAQNLSAVTVVGNALPAIDVSSVDSRTVLTSEQLQKLPVQRNITATSLLAPGTVAADARYGNVASFGGSSASENQYYINGFAVTNSLTGVGSITLPFDAIDQQQVLTGGYGPEYGRSTGGVVNIITKRGGNTWQGSAGVYWSPSSLEQSPKSIYHPKCDSALSNACGSIYQYRGDNTQSQLQYSAEIGGPLIKDKLFIYAAGDFVHGTGETIGTTASKQDTDYSTRATRWLGKIDWNITNDHIIELTGIGDNEQENDSLKNFNYATMSDTTYKGNAYTKNYNGVGTNATPGGTVWIAKYTGYITDDFTINALYGKTKSDHTQDVVSAAGDNCGLITDHRPEFAGNPQGGCNIVNSVLSPGANDKTSGWRIDLEYKLGSHDITGGVDNYNIRDFAGLVDPPAGEAVYYDNTGAPGTISGHPDVFFPAGTTQYVDLRYFAATAHVKVTQQAQYLQDRWQVTDRVLASIGLRNEQFDNYNGSNVVYAKQRHQLAPRLGATWDVFGDSTLKIYGNAGRYHLAIPANVAIRGASASTYTTQLATFTGIDPVTGMPEGVTKYGVTQFENGANGVAPDPKLVAARNLKAYFQDEYILGADKQLADNWTTGVKLTYRKLRSIIDDTCDSRPFEAYALAHNIPLTNPAYLYDPAAPGAPCFLSNPGSSNTYTVDTTGNGTYQTFDLSKKDLGFPNLKRKYVAADFYLQHDFSDGWYGKLEYVYSHSFGNSEGQLDSDIGQQDVSTTESWDFPEIMQGTNGSLPNDRRHVLKAYGFWQLNPEWLVGANLNLASGEPKSCMGLPPDPAHGGDPYGYGNNYFICGGHPVARGSRGRLPYTEIVNVNASYAPEVFAHKLTFSADIFNLFGQQRATSFYEYGETSNTNATNTGGEPDPDYGRVISYTAPRSVRLGVRYDFSL